jgi:hypothetical protein
MKLKTNRSDMVENTDWKEKTTIMTGYEISHRFGPSRLPTTRQGAVLDTLANAIATWENHNLTDREPKQTRCAQVISDNAIVATEHILRAAQLDSEADSYMHY